MSVVIKYAPMPLTTTEYEIMVQVQYPTYGTIPHVITIPNGIPIMLSGHGLEDLIHKTCKARFVTGANMDASTEILYIPCDILTPKNRVVKKVGFFTKLWNNIKEIV